MPGDREILPRDYTIWMGMPVFLKITAGDVRTTLFCTVLGESDATLRVRIADQWDVDIYKEMILVVDAFPHAGMDLAPQHPEEHYTSARPRQRHMTAIANGQPRTGGGDD